MTEEERRAVISYRFEQAESAIQSARLVIAHEDWFTAANRIYYGMFYALTALALVNGFKTSHHAQLLGWFNKNFVSTGEVSVEYGNILKEAFRIRMKGDYDVFVMMDPEKIKAMLTKMISFISMIKQIVINSE